MQRDKHHIEDFLFFHEQIFHVSLSDNFLMLRNHNDCIYRASIFHGLICNAALGWIVVQLHIHIDYICVPLAVHELIQCAAGGLYGEKTNTCTDHIGIF